MNFPMIWLLLALFNEIVDNEILNNKIIDNKYKNNIFVILFLY